MLHGQCMFFPLLSCSVSAACDVAETSCSPGAPAVCGAAWPRHCPLSDLLCCLCSSGSCPSHMSSLTPPFKPGLELFWVQGQHDQPLTLPPGCHPGLLLSLTSAGSWCLPDHQTSPAPCTSHSPGPKGPLFPPTDFHITDLFSSQSCSPWQRPLLGLGSTCYTNLPSSYSAQARACLLLKVRVFAPRLRREGDRDTQRLLRRGSTLGTGVSNLGPWARQWGRSTGEPLLSPCPTTALALQRAG